MKSFYVLIKIHVYIISGSSFNILILNKGKSYWIQDFNMFNFFKNKVLFFFNLWWPD